MLTVSGLSVAYGNISALRNCSLEVPDGKIVTLLGANGAGKTTTLNAIAGLLKLQSGTITFDGRRISGRTASEIVKLGISLVPEHRQLFPAMTVDQNLLLGAYTRGMGRSAMKERYRVFALFPELLPLRHAPAAMLSGGQQQMLAIGRGLMAQPRLLLLDEPSLGLAPMMVDRVLATLQQINARGLTVLLVEQNAYRTLPLSHTTYVLENGEVVLHGLSRDLMRDSRVQDSYLGTL
jgi:branched-chain amino acid transport system ATP-binding protein